VEKTLGGKKKMTMNKVLWIGLLAASLATAAKAEGPDFTLSDQEHLDVFTSYTNGTLLQSSNTEIFPGGRIDNLLTYDSSRVILSGGRISTLWTFGTSYATISDGFIDDFGAAGNSTVFFSGGGIGQQFNAMQNSTVFFSDGSTSYLGTAGNSRIEISGGTIGGWDIWGGLFADGASIVDISGGLIDYLHARQSSTTTLYGSNFQLSEGLSLIGNELFGTGILSGNWNNGNAWEINIYQHDSSASIFLVPEPAAVLLLGLGGLLIRKR
jgi:hypothetical protein